jgi:hypothetical protein
MKSPLRWLRTVFRWWSTPCQAPDLPLIRITAAQYGSTLRGLCLLALDRPGAERLTTGELFLLSQIGRASPRTPLEYEVARRLQRAAANPAGIVQALGERSPGGRAAVWAVTSRDGRWAVAVRWRDLAHLETPPAPGSEESG